LAYVHYLAGRQQDAERVCRGLLGNDPRDHGALHVLALMAQSQKRLAVAVRLARMAATLAPEVADYANTLGGVLAELGRTDDAVAALREAIRLRPQYPEAFQNLGLCLARAGRLEAAAAALEDAVRLRPGLRAAHDDLLAVRNEACDLPAMIAARRRIVRLSPEDAAAHSELLYLLHFCPDVTPSQMFEEHLEWAKRHEGSTGFRPVTPSTHGRETRATEGARLRIGYVASGFRDHPTARFQEQVLRRHDRSAVKVYCYADVPAKKADATTARLRGLADVWSDMAGMNDDAVAELVRSDQIDVLVDLHGHSTANRLPVFARRPAPVQVTYNGYVNTTGMAAMDWRITDALHDPPELGTDRYYTEKIYRLPVCNWCYQPDEDSPGVGELPAARNGFVTFGCLNQFIKALNPAVVRLWARVLEAVPGSRLVLLAPSPDPVNHSYALRWVDGHGVPPERVRLLGRMPRRDYLEAFNSIDVSLDPFPFNALPPPATRCGWACRW
jgi:predicted O-linked N-acetylglucosamine transferase (SPINDLY family)